MKTVCSMVLGLFASAALMSGQVRAADQLEGFTALNGKRVVVAYKAKGSQHYECTSSGWVHRGPVATLTNARGEPVGVHYSCKKCKKDCNAPDDPNAPSVPAWNFYDGGVLQVQAKIGHRSISPTAVDELALRTGGNGQGATASADHIRRVKTQKGVAPAAGTCTANTVGTWHASPYEAVYEFVDSTQSAPAAGRPAATSGAPRGSTKSGRAE